MKKILLIIMVFSIVLFGASSCKKVGVPDVAPTSVFEIASANLEGMYFIENTPSTEYKILVGSTTISNVDRKINFTYTSTTGAANGVQYTAPASLIIPAGKALDTLRLKGIFAGYPPGRKDKLEIQITGGDLPSFAGKDSFVLTLQSVCAVVLADFYGDYNNVLDNVGTTNEWGPYTATIVDGSAVSTGTTSGTIRIINLWDYYPPPPTLPATTLKLDWADPANFKVTIPDQKYITSLDLWIKGTETGTFSSCDQTFELKYTLYYKSTGEVYAENNVTEVSR